VEKMCVNIYFTKKINYEKTTFYDDVKMLEWLSAFQHITFYAYFTPSSISLTIYFSVSFLLVTNWLFSLLLNFHFIRHSFLSCCFLTFSIDSLVNFTRDCSKFMCCFNPKFVLLIIIDQVFYLQLLACFP